jgi:hypothetical protein
MCTLARSSCSHWRHSGTAATEHVDDSSASITALPYNEQKHNNTQHCSAAQQYPQCADRAAIPGITIQHILHCYMYKPSPTNEKQPAAAALDQQPPAPNALLAPTTVQERLMTPGCSSQSKQTVNILASGTAPHRKYDLHLRTSTSA